MFQNCLSLFQFAGPSSTSRYLLSPCGDIYTAYPIFLLIIRYSFLILNCIQIYMTSSFLIRTKQQFRPIDKPKVEIILEPDRVQFINCQVNKANYIEMVIRNESSTSTNFIIIQPKQPCFNVKAKDVKMTVLGKKQAELIVTFTPQHEKTVIQDSFAIEFEKDVESLVVPIVCKWRNLTRLKSYKCIGRKQNVRPSITLTLQSNLDPNGRPESRIRQSSLMRHAKISLATGDENQEMEIIGLFKLRFSHLEEYVREKKVKNQVYLGQEAISGVKRRQIVQFQIDNEHFAAESMKNEVTNRFKTKISETGPIIQIIGGLSVSWNKNRNQNRLIYDKAMRKIQQSTRKYILNLRFEKIHAQFQEYRLYQERISNSAVKCKDEVQQYIKKFQRKKEKFNRFANYDLQFEKSSISTLELEVEWEEEYSKRNHIFEINQRIGFDNWVPLQELAPHLHQILHFEKKQAQPQWLSYPQLDQSSRSGAGEEYSFKQKTFSEIDQERVTDFPLNLTAIPIETNIFLERHIRHRNQIPFNFQDIMEPKLQEVHFWFQPCISVLDPLKYCEQSIEPHFQMQHLSILDRNSNNSCNPLTTSVVIGSSAKEDLYRAKQDSQLMSNLLSLSERVLTGEQYRNGKINEFVDVLVTNFMKKEKLLERAMENIGNYKQSRLKQSLAKIDSWGRFLRRDLKLMPLMH